MNFYILFDSNDFSLIKVVMSKKINRNSPCHCGSEKKYKNCCLKNDSQPAKHTADGKFKFSAEMMSKKQQEEYSNIFTRLASSVTSSQVTLPSQKLQYQITKNKGSIGKKTIRSLKAKEERETNKKLQQHSFSFMNLDLESTSEDETKKISSDSQEFLPTTEDYRVLDEETKNVQNDLEN